MEGLNLMNPISFKEGQYTPADSAADYYVYSEADAYDLPTYAMWFSQAGTAAFTDEDKAQRMIDLYGPAAAVDAYAANPGNFVRDAAAGVYVNNWLEQNVDPGVTAEGKNADKLAALGVRYQDLSKRAIDLGADPEDIAQTTAQKVDKVAADYQTYYNDTHENTFFKFLLATGALFLGAYGLSQVLGAAGAGATGATAGATAGAGAGVGGGGGFIGGGYGSIGPVGFTSSAAPAYVGTNIPSTIFSNPTMPGYVSPGGAPVVSGSELLGGGLKLPGSVTGSTLPGASGVGNIKVAAGQGLAPNVGAKVGAGAQQIGAGSVGLKAPSWFLPSTPTPGGLSSFVNKAKDVLNTASDLSDVLGGGQQPQGQGKSGAPIYRNPAELFPVTNTMMSPEEIMARRTSKPTFVGGLEAIRNLT
jgi:hypothetical protein